VTEGNGTGLAITDLNNSNVGNKLGLLASSLAQDYVLFKVSASRLDASGITYLVAIAKHFSLLTM